MAVDLKEFDIAAELQENVQMLKDELSALQTDYEPELDAEEQMSVIRTSTTPMAHTLAEDLHVLVTQHAQVHVCVLGSKRLPRVRVLYTIQ